MYVQQQIAFFYNIIGVKWNDPVARQVKKLYKQ